MARRVLKVKHLPTVPWRTVAVASAVFLYQAGALAADKAPTCTGADAAVAAALWRQVKEFPTYALLRQRLGVPSSCSVSHVESRQSIVLQFARGGSLTLSSDSTLESSSLRALLPASAKLKRSQALRVLRATERQLAAPEGCGVAWPKLTRQPSLGTTDAEAEGTHCNCKARLGAERQHIVRLDFSLAC